MGGRGERERREGDKGLFQAGARHYRSLLGVLLQDWCGRMWSTKSSTLPHTTPSLV